jgi:hypothetical protein
MEWQVKVTLDTGVLDASGVKRVEEAAYGLPIEFSHSTVSERESENYSGFLIPSPSTRILETAVIGEARIGSAVVGSKDSEKLLRAILHVIASGNKPEPSQLRDALILLDHVRDGHNILVTTDVKAFIAKKDGFKRKELQKLCQTRIMTIDEFCEYCDKLR